MQTAINISLSAKHFTNRTKQIEVVGITDPQQCEKLLNECLLTAQEVAKDVNGTAAAGVAGQYGATNVLYAGEWKEQKVLKLTADMFVHSRNQHDGTVLILDGGTLAVAMKHCPEVFREAAW